MKLLGVWDTKKGFDRYIVIFTTCKTMSQVWTMSFNADSPQGACVFYGHGISDEYLQDCDCLGVDFRKIPIGIQNKINIVCKEVEK